MTTTAEGISSETDALTVTRAGARAVAANTDIAARYPVPLVIGVTGHRDLQPGELPRLRQMVDDFFDDLAKRFPHMPLRVMTPLAEGADRLVAAVAQAKGLPLIVPLPLTRDLYVEDFSDQASIDEFDQLCRDAEVIELPLASGNTEASVRKHGPARNLQYAKLGVFTCAHSHILLALWDGKASDRLGGTAQVVRFHQDDVMPGFTDDVEKSQLILADDESDLVYHIVCSRSGPDGEPEPPLKSLTANWFTTDLDQPRTDELPVRYEAIFRRTSEFNLDHAQHARRISNEKYNLLPSDAAGSLPASLRDIDDMFVIADWLAGYYQKRFNMMLRVTHILAVLMGLAFIIYSDLMADQILIFIFLAFFAVGVGMFAMAQRGAWHRKYLDYRALAEGMRVQFYWSAAGVRGGEATKYTHDNFLQKQDVELGWIRNVMRVAGLHSDVDLEADDGRGLEFVIEEWIGGVGAGQLGYYGRNAAKRASLHSITQHIGSLCLLGGIVVGAVLGILHSWLAPSVREPMIMLMGVLPLIAAVRDAYAHKKADKELIKQYRFMHRIFSNARRKIDAATSEQEQREILRALGDAALDEHAEWILIHRERPLEIGKL